MPPGATVCARAPAGLGLDVAASRVRAYASRHLIAQAQAQDEHGKDILRRM